MSYLAAVLIGVALVAAIAGLQILGIRLASARRRRAYRAERERERPFRELRRAFDDVEFARSHLRRIGGWRERGLLTDEQAEKLAAPVRAELEAAAMRLDQARAVIDEIAARS